MRKSRVRHGLNARVEVVDLRGAGLMKSSIVQFVASLLILLASLAPASLAQSSTTGAITGSAIDPSGAVVVGAEITATNDATGDVRTAVSTSNGVFLFPLLAPGSYTLKTSKAGIKELVRRSEITATNDATGDVRTAVSTSNGVFLFPLLAPGSYTLKTSKAGFKELVRTGVLVTVTETVRA